MDGLYENRFLPDPDPATRRSPLPMVSGVVLAAGRSERMGSPKLRLPLNGKSLIRHVVDAALGSGLSEVVVVLGHLAPEVETEMPDDVRVRTVLNPNYMDGQHSSLRKGIAALDPASEGAIILLGDQPSIGVEVIDRLIAAFVACHARVVVPVYGGRKGHPILFSRSLYPELLAASLDQGRRSVVLRYQNEAAVVEILKAPPVDVDTPEDYLRLKNEMAPPGEG